MEYRGIEYKEFKQKICDAGIFSQVVNMTK